MNQELAYDLLKKILKRTNEIGDEVQQMRQDLTQLELLLKPPNVEYNYIYIIFFRIIINYDFNIFF